MFYQTATHLHQKYSFKNRQEQNSCRQFVKILILFLSRYKERRCCKFKNVCHRRRVMNDLNGDCCCSCDFCATTNLSLNSTR